MRAKRLIKSITQRAARNAILIIQRIMLPSRTSHSASIGPGVVPRGVDPHYDAEVAREYESRKNVPHNAKGSFGRPFAIDPRASGPMTRTQCVVLF